MENKLKEMLKIIERINEKTFFLINNIFFCKSNKSINIFDNELGFNRAVLLINDYVFNFEINKGNVEFIINNFLQNQSLFTTTIKSLNSFCQESIDQFSNTNFIVQNWFSKIKDETWNSRLLVLINETVIFFNGIFEKLDEIINNNSDYDIFIEEWKKRNTKKIDINLFIKCFNNIQNKIGALYIDSLLFCKHFYNDWVKHFDNILQPYDLEIEAEKLITLSLKKYEILPISKLKIQKEFNLDNYFSELLFNEAVLLYKVKPLSEEDLLLELKRKFNDIYFFIKNFKINTQKDLLKFTLICIDKVLEFQIKKHEGYKYFWWDSKYNLTTKKEEDYQPYIKNLLDFPLGLCGVSIIPEPESASGKIDFLIKYTKPNNEIFSIAVEVKNAHHLEIEKKIKTQLPEYLKSENAYGVYLVFWFQQNTKYPNINNLFEAIKNNKPKDFEIEVKIIDCTKPISPSKILKYLEL